MAASLSPRTQLTAHLLDRAPSPVAELLPASFDVLECDRQHRPYPSVLVSQLLGATDVNSVVLERRDPLQQSLRLARPLFVQLAHERSRARAGSGSFGGRDGGIKLIQMTVFAQRGLHETLGDLTQMLTRPRGCSPGFPRDRQVHVEQRQGTHEMLL